MSDFVNHAEKNRGGHYHGGFLATFAGCGWKKMVWNLLEAAMTDQGAAENAVLLLTGPIDPLRSDAFPTNGKKEVFFVEMRRRKEEGNDERRRGKKMKVQTPPGNEAKSHPTVQ